MCTRPAARAGGPRLLLLRGNDARLQLRLARLLLALVPFLMAPAIGMQRRISSMSAVAPAPLLSCPMGGPWPLGALRQLHTQ